MTRDTLIAYAATQIWQVSYLVVYVLGLIIALSRCLSSLNQYLLMQMRFAETRDYAAIGRMSMLFFFPIIALHLGGLGLVMAAVFVKRPPPPSGL